MLLNKINTYEHCYVPGLGLHRSMNKSVPLNGSEDGSGGEKWLAGEAVTSAGNKG